MEQKEVKLDRKKERQGSGEEGEGEGDGGRRAKKGKENEYPTQIVHFRPD